MLIVEFSKEEGVETNSKHKICKENYTKNKLIKMLETVIKRKS